MLIYRCIYIYVYIYVYICIDTYIYIHIYIYSINPKLEDDTHAILCLLWPVWTTVMWMLAYKPQELYSYKL